MKPWQNIARTVVRKKLKKFDYTSYDDNIPYYTMIVYENKEKIKLLLDLKRQHAGSSQTCLSAEGVYAMKKAKR